MKEKGMTNLDGTTIPPFVYFFRIEVAMLKMMGLSSFKTVFLNDEFNSNWRHGVVTVIGAMTVLSCAFCQVHKIFFGASEISLILATSLNVTALLIGALRGFRCLTHQRILYKILHRLSTLWELAISNNCLADKNLTAAYRVRRMTGIYSIIILVLNSLFILRPYILLINYRLHRETNDTFNYNTFILVDEYAFTIESKRGYFSFIFYEEMVIHISSFCWICSDSLFAQLLMHVSIQFHILAYNLENICKDDENEDESRISQRLRNLAKQHDQLFEFCNLIEAFYNPIIFLTMLSSAANACCCLYAMEAQISIGNWKSIPKSAMYLLFLAFQIVLYCGYAETLTQSSIRVFYACTWAPWTGLSKRNKIILFMIMMRAQKKYEYTVYGMIVVNLNRLTMIANGSISYFMLLRNFG